MPGMVLREDNNLITQKIFHPYGSQANIFLALVSIQNLD